MNLCTKEEILILDVPHAEPNEKWYDGKYYIRRCVDEDGSIVWYGISKNWKKELNGNWTELIKMNWVECDIPIYEEMYIKKFKSTENIKNIINGRIEYYNKTIESYENYIKNSSDIQNIKNLISNIEKIQIKISELQAVLDYCL